jgi:hypothetical protein
LCVVVSAVAAAAAASPSLAPSLQPPHTTTHTRWRTARCSDRPAAPSARGLGRGARACATRRRLQTRCRRAGAALYVCGCLCKLSGDVPHAIIFCETSPALQVRCAQRGVCVRKQKSR